MARRMCEVDIAQRMRKVLLYEPVKVNALGIDIILESAGIIHLSSRPDFYDDEDARELAEMRINDLRESALRYKDERRTSLAHISLNVCEQFNDLSGNNKLQRLPFMDIATTDWMPTISFNSRAYDRGLTSADNYVHVPIDPMNYSCWEELVEDNSDLFLKFLAMAVIKEIKGHRFPALRGQLDLYYEDSVAKLRWHDTLRDTYDVELSDLLNKNGKLSIRSLRKFIYDKRSKIPMRKIEVPMLSKVTRTTIIEGDLV